MYTTEKIVALLSKEPVSKIQEIYKLTELVSLLNYVTAGEEHEKTIHLNYFGDLLIDEYGDLEFLASKNFLKDLSTIEQNNPEFYIKKEIGKVLGVDLSE